VQMEKRGRDYFGEDCELMFYRKTETGNRTQRSIKSQFILYEVNISVALLMPFSKGAPLVMLAILHSALSCMLSAYF
jgi:hypothetical protein